MADVDVTMVFTRKGVDLILAEGGTSAWHLHRSRARACRFAVCTRNARHPLAEGKEPHQAAFMVGKIKDVVEVKGAKEPGERGRRYLLQFSEYALVSVPKVWKGDRNPVKYAKSLGALGIDESSLHWTQMPQPTAAPQLSHPQKTPTVAALTMSEAKQGLALTFGVSPDAIEITVRG